MLRSIRGSQKLENVIVRRWSNQLKAPCQQAVSKLRQILEGQSCERVFDNDGRQVGLVKEEWSHEGDVKEELANA